MPKTSSPRLEDVAVFTQAVENVFRKLVRILVGRISLLKLQEMMSFIYVEETEKILKQDRPGKNIPLTRLALMTGLDSRTVVSIKSRIEASGLKYKQKFLKELTPESAVVEEWANRINAASPKDKHKLRTMAYGTDEAEFEKLIRATITSRGITSQSIIQRLVTCKNITQKKTNKTITLVVDKFTPYLSDDEPQIFNAAFTGVSNLLSTAEHNINTPSEARLFQRDVWTFHLPRERQHDFKIAMRKFLENTEDQARLAIEPWEVKGSSANVISAGVGFYYFDEPESH